MNKHNAKHIPSNQFLSPSFLQASSGIRQVANTNEMYLRSQGLNHKFSTSAQLNPFAQANFHTLQEGNFKGENDEAIVL